MHHAQPASAFNPSLHAPTTCGGAPTSKHRGKRGHVIQTLQRDVGQAPVPIAARIIRAGLAGQPIQVSLGCKRAWHLGALNCGARRPGSGKMCICALRPTGVALRGRRCPFKS